MNILKKALNYLLDNENYQKNEPPTEKQVVPAKPKEEPILEYDGWKVGEEVIMISGYFESYPLQENYKVNEYPAKVEITKIKEFRKFTWGTDIIYENKGKGRIEKFSQERLNELNKILAAEKDFKVEFKIRKLEQREDYSVWWRSLNHPDFREWRPIVRIESDSNRIDGYYAEGHLSQEAYTYIYDKFYHPYFFDSKEDAEQAIELLKTRDPKTLKFFQRKWQDI